MEELIERIRLYMFEAISLVRSRCWCTAAKLLRDTAKLCDRLQELEEEERAEKK